MFVVKSVRPLDDNGRQIVVAFFSDIELLGLSLLDVGDTALSLDVAMALLVFDKVPFGFVRLEVYGQLRATYLTRCCCQLSLRTLARRL